MADDVILLTKLVPDFNCKYMVKKDEETKTYCVIFSFNIICHIISFIVKNREAITFG